MKPLVSLLCITYNHEKYIREALDSFLMQKTNFPIEIIIHDDASTDGTIKILKEYQNKYPIVNLIIEKENQFSQDNASAFLENMYKSAKGKYIAWCEGDDYWTDPNKIQVQADFLEENPGYSICFHPVKVEFESNTKKQYLYPDPSWGRIFDTEELLKMNFIQTNSVMYRKQKYGKIPAGIIPQDWYMHLYHAKFGTIGFIDKPMAVYRIHGGGVWSDSRENIGELWQKHGTAHLKFFAEVLKMFKDDPKKCEIIEKTVSKTIYDSIVSEKSDKENRTFLFKKVLENFPQFIEPYLLYVHKEHNQYVEMKKLAEDKKTEIMSLSKKLEEKEKAIKRRDSELERIKSSRFWRARTSIGRFLKK